MEYLYASLLGIVQGITEFLPISSSGHLILLHEALDFQVGSDLAFSFLNPDPILQSLGDLGRTD